MDKQNALCIHNGILCSFFKRKDILTHATTCMNLEGIMPGEKASQKRINTMIPPLSYQE